jgi:hypothetical protein
MVTHDRDLAAQAERTLELADGEIVGDWRNQLGAHSRQNAAEVEPSRAFHSAPLSIARRVCGDDKDYSGHALE